MRRARLDRALAKKDEFDKKDAAKDILSFTLADQVLWSLVNCMSVYVHLID